MRSKENFTPHISTALVLTLGILFTFQAYLFQEPARIEADKARELQIAIDAGDELFSENCSSCHGDNGEGDIGPALNSRPLLETTMDEVFFNLTRTGIPSTIMPAWGQVFGGPLTDEQVDQLVAYIRSWEPTAPDPVEVVNLPNPVRGATIYAQTCFICHGEKGEGSESVPALNDPERLAELDDVWYRRTISFGRPAKGMPTWGTVLSPGQINDLVALLAAWRDGRDVIVEIPLSRSLTNALFALRAFDRVDAEFYLNIALNQANNEQKEAIRQAISLIQENRLFEAEANLISLLPPEEMGQALYESNCSACHGADGTGDLGPSLHNNVFIQTKDYEEVVELILKGRPNTGMDGFEGILFEDEIYNLIAFLQTWQE